jgi:hypothetical protein
MKNKPLELGVSLLVLLGKLVLPWQTKVSLNKLETQMMDIESVQCKSSINLKVSMESLLL